MQRHQQIVATHEQFAFNPKALVPINHVIVPGGSIWADPDFLREAPKYQTTFQVGSLFLFPGDIPMVSSVIDMMSTGMYQTGCGDGRLNPSDLIGKKSAAHEGCGGFNVLHKPVLEEAPDHFARRMARLYPKTHASHVVPNTKPGLHSEGSIVIAPPGFAPDPRLHYWDQLNTLGSLPFWANVPNAKQSEVLERGRCVDFSQPAIWDWLIGIYIAIAADEHHNPRMQKDPLHIVLADVADSEHHFDPKILEHLQANAIDLAGMLLPKTMPLNFIGNWPYSFN